MNNCKKCEELNLKVLIRSSGELEKAIRVIKANLEDKTIIQTSNTSIDFKNINISGPWEDVLNYKFKCTNCGRIFIFGVDTYHCRGGSWRPIIDEDSQ